MAHILNSQSVLLWPRAIAVVVCLFVRSSALRHTFHTSAPTGLAGLSLCSFSLQEEGELAYHRLHRNDPRARSARKHLPRKTPWASRHYCLTYQMKWDRSWQSSLVALAECGKMAGRWGKRTPWSPQELLNLLNVSGLFPLTRPAEVKQECGKLGKLIGFSRHGHCGHWGMSLDS